MTFFNPIGESWIYKLYKQKHMKTAMQEHFEWLEENQLELDIPIAAIDNAEDLIYKEKQQIIEAYNANDSYNKAGDMYYEETYNQNK